MLSANTFTIRDASAADVPELVRLGWATEEDWPAGRILVGEIRGVIAAALAVDENRTVYAAVPGAPYLLAHIRARAAAMEAHERTPSLAERIRERLQPRTTAPV